MWGLLKVVLHSCCKSCTSALSLQSLSSFLHFYSHLFTNQGSCGGNELPCFVLSSKLFKLAQQLLTVVLWYMEQCSATWLPCSHGAHKNIILALESVKGKDASRHQARVWCFSHFSALLHLFIFCYLKMICDWNMMKRLTVKNVSTHFTFIKRPFGVKQVPCYFVP